MSVVRLKLRAPRAPFVLSALACAAGQVFAQSGSEAVVAKPGPEQTAAQPADKKEGAPQPDAKVTAAQALDAVTVTGRALSVKKAIAEKRAQSVVSDGVSADEIGSIPDYGLGQALERVTGVSMIINNGRGESQFMSVRGLNSDYNAVTIDGIALPGTETTRRIVSLDVLPSSLAKDVRIYKTFTPEMDGNAIGGLTNLRTRSAFDRPGFQATVRGDLSDWTSKPRLRSHSPSGELESTVSNTFGDQNQFGALLSASWYRRTSSSLNTIVASDSYFANAGTQPNGAKLNPATTDVNNAFVFPDQLRWLNYDNVRTRGSVFGKLDFAGDAFRSHISGGWFQHINDEHRHAFHLQNDTTPASQVTIGDGFGSAASGQAQADYAKFKQVRLLSYVEGGAEAEPWLGGKVDATVNLARGSYRQDALLYTFVQANNSGLAYDYTQSPGGVPVFVPRNNGQLFDASRYTMTGVNGSEPEESKTRQNTIQLNVAHNLSEDARGWGFKGGVQWRDADKRYNYDEQLFVTAAGQPATTLAQAGVNPTVYVPYTSASGLPMLFVDQYSTANFVAANQGRYAPAATNTANSTQRDFRVKERVQAAYAMTAYQAESMTTVFGARVERTLTDIDTFIPQPLNQSTTFSAFRGASSRTDILPSLNWSWAATDTLRIRAGISESLGRALYSQLAQNSSATSGTTINTTLANPALQPRKSRNLDLSVEWYPNPNEALSAALFSKEIRNEIANVTTTQTVTIGSQAYTQNVTQANNVGKAKVSGIELGYTQVKFKGLPAPFNDFGVTANATFMDQSAASIRMADGSLRQLPGFAESPKTIANLSLLWSHGPYSGQVAYKRTGKTLITASSSSAAQDIFVDTSGVVDAQLRYQINPHFTILAQAQNLTDEPGQRRITGPGGNVFYQEIHNGRSFWLGATYAY